MSEALFFQGGQIAAEEGPLVAADVWVENGVIRAVGQGLPTPEGARVIDCEGKILLPALFDAHVHFRDPGQTQKEDIATGTEAAINGGITGVVMMPNTSPAIDSAAVVKMVLDKAKAVSRIPVYTSGCITKGREGKELAAIDGMRELGVLMLTDDGDAVPDSNLLLQAMRYAKEFGMFFASHCEDPALAGPRAMNEGKKSYELGIDGTPACAEELFIDRDIRLAHAAGAHVHIQHVSSRLGMETIRWWKEMGARVTCEVAPHHLLFNEEDIGDYDTNYKMNPPLRLAEDNAALLQGLKEGVFDLIATDHAPHTEFEKSQDFVSAPNGLSGLETALVSLHDRFIARGELDWAVLVKRYSAEPRRLMKLDPVPIQEGGRAELLVFDPKAETTFDRAFLKSKSVNTPFYNQTLQGKITHVLAGEELLLER
ncbi:dihydroorotase [Roseibacillus ishigakijimensis]|uniref:Dihydroorotase n=1 Tax=Roseibacillus ishigakijimensis TaxID=454146 RepID=A0A934VMG8_9BACT|nr:dihydroorotase [Roseibacillus ishigakijimensis]MBK1834076.1 dihydroorotase [Roseibacillus ishigakijimensis]